MSIELRPLGVACNLACHYCYQNPQRDAGNQRMTYDLEKMKAAALRIGGPFTLFGGEPLLMRFEDLQDLLAWGLERFGGSSIQTNGVLIEERHIDLFRRCKVSVGISIDGPGALNDARRHHTLEKTRQSTAAVEDIIARLCREHQPPALIVTLHKGNAAAGKLSAMVDWLRKLHASGVRSVRLHLLEIDHASVRTHLALSPRENIEALLAFAAAQEDLKGMQFDLFDEMERLLAGRDGGVGCTWRACDPYTTEAVQGVEGNGQSSNCGRTNKEGIGFIKASGVGYERYLALYRTPQSDGGCAGCRFFLMCKGQCPGTAIDGDWRNRTEHCQEWMHLFARIERRMILAGKVPLTIQPLRFELERRQVEAWERGANPSIARSLSLFLQAPAAAKSQPPAPVMPKVRVSWVGDRARDLWKPRLLRLARALEEITVHAAGRSDRCAARLVPAARGAALLELAARHGVDAAILPAEILPGAICTAPNEAARVVFLAGTPAAIAAAQAAWKRRDTTAFQNLLDVPACCLAANRTAAAREDARIPPAVLTHALLAPLGISLLPVEPCSFHCVRAIDAGDRWLALAASAGYAAEAGWLRECLSWAISWSDLHGVTEVKTPLFRLCFHSPHSSRRVTILREGSSEVEGSSAGLNFPYSQPARQHRLVNIGAML